MASGRVADSSNFKAALRTCAWRSMSCGADSGRPITCWVNKTLAGFIATTLPRKTFDITMTVGIPSDSNALLTCPTDT